MLRKALIPFLIVSGMMLPALAAAAADTPPPTRVLSLETCLQLGFANSRELQQETQNMKVAQESVNQAAAGFRPTVDYSVNRVQQTAGTDYNSGTISIDLPLLNRGKLSNSLRVALLGLDSAKEDERQTRLQLTYDIKAGFYDLWLKEQQLAVAQASYDNLGQHYQQVEKYYQVGKKSKYELLEAEVSWKQQKAEVISAKSEVALARLTLATLIGIDKDQAFQLAYDSAMGQIPAQVNLTLNPLLEKAYRQRPDMIQAEQATQIAQYNVEIAKANLNPALSLSGTHADSTDNWQYVLGVSGTLYDGKVTASKVKAAEETLQLARINAAKTRDSARENIQKALQTVQVDWEKAGAYQANVELAKEDLRMTEIRYNAGVATIMDVRDRQLALDEAQDQYYQAVSSYRTGLAKLELELGN
jgi:outer membrane protein TolC